MFSEFATRLTQALETDINILLNKHPSDVFAVALVTDSDFVTMHISIGTICFLHRYVHENEFYNWQEFSGSVWTPDEWDESNCDYPNSSLMALYDDLTELYESNGSLESFDAYKIAIENTFIHAMTNLNLVDNRCFLFVCETDACDDVYLPNKSSLAINSAEKHHLFLQRYTHQFDFYPNVTIKPKPKRFLP